MTDTDPNIYSPDDDDAKSTETPVDKGRPLLVTVIAVAVLAALSLVPWSKLTDSKLKDYNLVSDLLPSEADSVVGGYEFVDPELLAIMKADSALNASSDVLRVEEYHNSTPHAVASTAAVADASDTTDVVPAIAESRSPRANGDMVVEDYTPSGSGLRHLKAALARRDGRPVRIGVIGDSYIEGDIFTSDIRRLMQDKYGGNGVGYMAASSHVAGFRPTVKHTNSGWTQHPIADAAKSKFFNLAGEYYTGSVGATIKYKGVKNKGHVEQWNNSQLVFVAPASGTITMEIEGETQTFDIAASDAVQSIALPGATTYLNVVNNVPGLVLLGAWLNDSNGVVVDCMSVRGDSGVNRRNINTDMASQMRQYVDYDLIVVEYGINALTSKQRDYTTYGNTMAEVVKRIQQCYPNADIILMGIGDRGQKINGEAHSFATAPNMVEAQRNAARKAGVLFYDTRESMGGEDAIVRWRNDKLANGDYIHLNFDGGKALATTFVDALTRKLSE